MLNNFHYTINSRYHYIIIAIVIVIDIVFLFNVVIEDYAISKLHIQLNVYRLYILYVRLVCVCVSERVCVCECTIIIISYRSPRFIYLYILYTSSKTSQDLIV